MRAAVGGLPFPEQCATIGGLRYGRHLRPPRAHGRAVGVLWCVLWVVWVVRGVVQGLFVGGWLFEGLCPCGAKGQWGGWAG